MLRLNASGAAVWTAIAAPVAVPELVEDVAAAFEVDTSLVEADVLALLDELHERGLIVRE